MHHVQGYLCCKPRVLEFDEFLKIKGCKTGRHCFAPKKKEDQVRSADRVARFNVQPYLSG